MSITRRPKIIFEIANNHQGDRAHFRQILAGLEKCAKPYPFDFYIKFGYRDLDNFIHSDENYVRSCDGSLVDRLRSAALSFVDYAEMREEVRRSGFGAICTPFDEASVDQVVLHQFDYLKVASASINDWPLLHSIGQQPLPVIASTGGVDFDQLDHVVDYLDSKGVPVTLMHCVGLYPTPSEALQMNRIDSLKSRYPGKEVGFSTHIDPFDNLSTVMAIAKGAYWQERHVGLRTDRYGLNAYSLDMPQVEDWLRAISNALSMSREHSAFTGSERVKLDTIARAYFMKHPIAKGAPIGVADLYLSFPAKPTAFMAYDYPLILSGTLRATQDLPADSPLLRSNASL